MISRCSSSAPGCLSGLDGRELQGEGRVRSVSSPNGLGETSILYSPEKKSRGRSTTANGRSSQKTLFNTTEDVLCIDGILCEPNGKTITKGIARAMYLKLLHNNKMMEEDEICQPGKTAHVPSCFDEDRYSFTLIKNYTLQRHVDTFVNSLFLRPDLFKPIYGIITIVYIDRFLSSSHLVLNSNNWKLIFFAAATVAAKTWDEQRLRNEDFLRVCPERWMTIELMNKLERKFLKWVNFDLVVTTSLYSQYYFEIRGFCDILELKQEWLLEQEKNKLGLGYSNVTSSSLMTDFIGNNNNKAHSTSWGGGLTHL